MPSQTPVDTSYNPYTATNPFPVQSSQGGAAASATNPIPTQLSLANVAVAAANALPVTMSHGGAVASATNPVPAGPHNVDTAALITLSAAGAGTTNSADQTNLTGRGVMVVVDYTAETGTPTLTVTIQGKDAASGKYYTLLESAALDAVATTLLQVYPGSTAAANTIANKPLPKVWRISAVVAGGTPAVTATIGASVIV